MRTILLAAFCLVALMTHVSTVAADTFSHDDWDAVLSKFVDDQGFVDYQRLAKDRAAFDAYLKRIERQSPDSHPQLFPDKSHELAYWINAYNAHVIHGVLEEGADIKSVWGFLGTGYSFFVGMKIELGGTTTNLKKLEDDVIRKRYGDPRIHAAINCASISCPRLPREAFTGTELDTQLDAAMGKFVTAEKHFEIDSGDQTVRVSKIFDWFEDDFLSWEKKRGNSSPTLISYINLYRGDGDKIPAGYKVEFLDYDKGLNAQR